jgi:hypothetical protein
MIHSGLDEFPHVNEVQIRKAMEMIKLSGTVRNRVPPTSHAFKGYCFHVPCGA